MLETKSLQRLLPSSLRRDLAIAVGAAAFVEFALQHAGYPHTAASDRIIVSRIKSNWTGVAKDSATGILEVSASAAARTALAFAVISAGAVLYPPIGRIRNFGPVSHSKEWKIYGLGWLLKKLRPGLLVLDSSVIRATTAAVDTAAPLLANWVLFWANSKIKGAVLARRRSIAHAAIVRRSMAAEPSEKQLLHEAHAAANTAAVDHSKKEVLRVHLRAAVFSSCAFIGAYAVGGLASLLLEGRKEHETVHRVGVAVVLAACWSQVYNGDPERWAL